MKSTTIILALAALTIVPSSASAQLFRGQLIRNLFGNERSAQSAPDNKDASKETKKKPAANKPKAKSVLKAQPKPIQKKQADSTVRQPRNVAIPATGPVRNAILDAVFAPRNKRLFVTKLSPSGYGAKSGLKLGDELLEVGSLPIENPQELTEIFKVLNEGDQLVFLVRRKSEKKEIVVSFGESKQPALTEPALAEADEDPEHEDADRDNSGTLTLPTKAEADQESVDTDDEPESNESELKQLRRLVHIQQQEIARLRVLLENQ